MKNSQPKYSDHRMSEYGDLQGRAITALFQAAKTKDDLLAMQRGVAFLASQLAHGAVLEVGRSAEAAVWARRAAKQMWAEYDCESALREEERQAEAAGRLVRFPRVRRS